MSYYSTSDFDNLGKLGEAMLDLYPRYFLRIYHNVSEDNPEHRKLCDLFCLNDHIDICDVRKLGNLKVLKLIGTL